MQESSLEEEEVLTFDRSAAILELGDEHNKVFCKIANFLQNFPQNTYFV